MDEAQYTVFVDESFYQWFGLPKKESNICYAALSIPTSRLDDLKRFETGIREAAFNYLPEDKRTGRQKGEFKYADFRFLCAQSIDTLGKKFASFLGKNKAIVFGYFIPAEGLFNYELRSDYIDNPQALKTLSDEEYAKKIEEIRNTRLQAAQNQKHSLGFLQEIYKAFFNFIVQHHGHHLKKTFRIVYDSRNAEEDAAIHQHAEDFARLADRATPGGFAYYEGFERGTSSDSPGLRLADWVAGEVRNFFYRNPAIVGGDSVREVLSPYLNPKMMLVDGIAPYYPKNLSPEAKDCFNSLGRGFMFPQIKQFFASGLLTYYAQRGEARHIFLPKLTALDMAD